MFLFWILCSIAFLIMLILTLRKRKSKQNFKVFGIITAILFVIGFICFLNIALSPAVDENTNDNTESNGTNSNSELDNKVESVIFDVQLAADKDITNLADEGKISKSESRKITTKIGNKADKVKNDIKKDKKYDSLKKEYAKGNVSSSELSDFMEPYLKEIDDVVLDNLSK